MKIVFDDSEGGRQQVDILERQPDQTFEVGGRRVSFREIDAGQSGRVRIAFEGEALEGWRWVAGNDVYLKLAGRHWHFRRAGVEAGDTGAGSAHAEVRAEMPGTVVAIHAQVGAQVAQGDRLLTIESMKLQMTLAAPRAGRIQAVHVATNASFDRGVTLVSFEPEAESSISAAAAGTADAGKAN